jgi:hypothetical protein
MDSCRCLILLCNVFLIERQQPWEGLSGGGGKEEKTWKHRIDGVMDDGLGHVLHHTQCRFLYWWARFAGSFISH